MSLINILCILFRNDNVILIKDIDDYFDKYEK